MGQNNIIEWDVSFILSVLLLRTHFYNKLIMENLSLLSPRSKFWASEQQQFGGASKNWEWAIVEAVTSSNNN